MCYRLDIFTIYRSKTDISVIYQSSSISYRTSSISDISKIYRWIYRIFLSMNVKKRLKFGGMNESCRVFPYSHADNSVLWELSKPLCLFFCLMFNVLNREEEAYPHHSRSRSHSHSRSNQLKFVHLSMYRENYTIT